ncbi:S-adenosyl-L-methionine-dependent methyltransferase [Trinorchestia longiramus]|nr:S-adenosyl-L-methionine-dependent methyltransferase [Trinorchestia longiramus]
MRKFESVISKHNADCDPSHTLHVDAFLYDEDLVDELCDTGELGRNYCLDCSSHNTQPITYISHSASRERLAYVFRALLPPVPEDAIVVDVGSRLGAVLYGVRGVQTVVNGVRGIQTVVYGVHSVQTGGCAVWGTWGPDCDVWGTWGPDWGLCCMGYVGSRLVYGERGVQTVVYGVRGVQTVVYWAYVYTKCRNIIGVELNEDLCTLQRNIVAKYNFQDRIRIAVGDVQLHSTIVNSADVLVLNNVFEFFMAPEVQLQVWNFLRATVKRGALLVTIPALQDQLQHFDRQLVLARHAVVLQLLCVQKQLTSKLSMFASKRNVSLRPKFVS